MTYINDVTLCGVIADEPKTTTFEDGNSIVTFALKTQKNFSSKTGKQYSVENYHKVAVRNGAVLNDAKHFLQKGNTVIVRGELEVRSFDDNNGQTKSLTQITVNPFSGTILNVQTMPSKQQTNNSYINDDNIPF